MNDEQIDTIIAKLNEATEILTKEIPLPDMEVSEWVATPVGRAVSLITKAIEMLVEE